LRELAGDASADGHYALLALQVEVRPAMTSIMIGCVSRTGYVIPRARSGRVKKPPLTLR
jgi:hypothetical protein